MRLAHKLGAEAERQNLTEEELLAQMDADRQVLYDEMFSERNQQNEQNTG